MASVVMTVRRDTDGLIEDAVPEAPDPETLEVFHAPGPQGQTSMIRPVGGAPPLGETTRGLFIGSGTRLDVRSIMFSLRISPIS